MDYNIYIVDVDSMIEECEQVLQTLKNVKSSGFKNSYFQMVFCSAYCRRIFEFCDKYILEYEKEIENEKK